VPDHHATFADVVSGQATTAPGQSWLESATGDRTVDRAEVASLVDGWGREDLRGRRLGLLATDPVAFGALFVALVAAGATVVPVDAQAPPDAVRAHLATGRAEAVVTTDAERVPPGSAPVVLASPASLRPVGGRPPGRSADPTASGGCLLLSSGSTGPRKAIRLAEAQLLHVARAVVRSHRLTDADRAYNPLPLFHVNGEVVGLLAPLLSGGTVVLADRFHRTGFWPLVDRRQVTWVNAVPAIVAILAQEPGGDAAPPRLRFVRSASAPLPIAVLHRFEARYGVPVVESYGMTEAASQITVNPLADRRPGTVGRPVDVELAVVDDEGRRCGPGAVGHVRIRGGGVVRHYQDGVGADRFDAEGWLDTGDLGALDAAGYLTLAGRDADVINRSGEKIFPREVEEVLSAHPRVRETVVVARPEPVLGEVPVAYVVATDDAPEDLEEQLAARCAAALPRAHRPTEIHIVEALQRGPTGKPLRRLLPVQEPA
jgi:acyl-CoA synthetase (AMP-forming)/AMP-acid ligase II